MAKSRPLVIVGGVASKECLDCRVTKAVSEFSKQAANKDGIYSYCKKCVSATYRMKYLSKEKTPEYVSMRRAYRAAHVVERRERGRKWDERHREQRRAKSRKHYAANRGAEIERAKRVRAENREKCKARDALNCAVRYGRLKRLPCADCGTCDNVQGHHHDYSKPLDVTWLCGVCHGRRHRV